MSCFMGGRDDSTGPIPVTANGYVLYYSKETDIPRPSQMWVLLDEDERSINDGFFVTDPSSQMWYDFPANSVHRHNFSFTLAFADGSIHNVSTKVEKKTLWAIFTRNGGEVVDLP